ncbi:MAG: ribosomal-protein-alanine N-acetyltransferase [Methylococcaceae bacterium]|nr:MAG: ribosomal-protein-alanine N-acetyltransferase [Methylococcaceae bacterium]
MHAWLNRINNMLRYDAERDFYAKHFPSLMAEEFRFRPMLKTDVKAVAAIEAAGTEFPWSEGTFHDCFKAHYHCWVGQFQTEVVAFGILSVVLDEAHVMNLGVAPTNRRKGYGRKMLQKLVDEATAHKVENLFLEVRPSNTPALQLYETMGFNEVGRRKYYYPIKGGREDALLLARTLFLSA